MYNPFVPFNDTILKRLLDERHYLFIIQRFEWPQLEKGKGFMVSPYKETDTAFAHASHLTEKEGKLLDAREHLDKIQVLTAKGSGYRLFLNKFRDDNWKNRMLKMYKDHIISYLRTRTRFQPKDTIDIKFTMEYGRVIAIITNGERTMTVRAVELIN